MIIKKIKDTPAFPRSVIIISPIIISILLYIISSMYVGWDAIVSIFSNIGFTGLVIALFLSLVNYFLRFIRWQLYLQHLGYNVPHWESFNIYLSGFAFTTTPGKAGEAIRSFFLKKYQIPIPTSLAALFSERLSDLLAILLLSCLGLLSFSEARLPIITSLVFISFLLWIVLTDIPSRFIKKLSASNKKKFRYLIYFSDIINQKNTTCTATIFMLTTIVSLVAWGSEALAFYLLLDWTGFSQSLPFAAFVYALSMLIGALSFLPGGLGGAEGTMISMLLLKGINLSTAIALTIFTRLVTLWFAVFLGIIALYQCHRRNSRSSI